MKARGDFVGHRFGRLVVLNCSLYRQEKTKVRTMWLVGCDCGTEKIVRSDGIKCGSVRSCGCLNRDNAKELLTNHNYRTLPKGQADFNRKLKTYQKEAKDRGLAFALTKEQFRSLSSSACRYCGSPPTGRSRRRDTTVNGYFLSNGIDRVDNNQGYTLDNVVPCCKACNRMKHALTLDQFLEHVEKIYKHTLKEL